MCCQVIVCVLKIPQIICNNETPCHIRPKHIIMFLGCVDSPPSCHTEDIQDSGNSVHPVPPSSVEPYIFWRQPPAVTEFFHCHESTDTWFKITYYCNQNIDCNDCKREYFEPFCLTNSPFVFQHHKTNTPCCCSIQFCIMEPACHMYISIVIQCPFCAICCTDIDCDEIHCKYSRNSSKTDQTADFCTSCEFICKNKSGKHQYPP